jgi:stearoyl-CoA desaturase (delta-9 desaturase)
MNRSYLNITFESVGLFLLVSFAWVIGAGELYDTITHLNTQWYWLVAAILYTVTLNELFCHRICSHALFNVDINRITYKVLTFLLTVDHGWSPLTVLCGSHRNHHMYSDQSNKDSLNWRIHWYNLCLLSPISYIYQVPTDYPDKEKFIAQEQTRFKKYNDDLWTFFVEHYRLPLTIIFWAVLYLVAPVVLFKLILMSRFIMSAFMAMAAIGGHYKLPFSYRNFNTNDTSQNNLILHCLALGTLSTMLHNNHHGKPAASNHAHKWFEFDLGCYIIKLLRPLLEKKDSQKLSK